MQDEQLAFPFELFDDRSPDRRTGNQILKSVVRYLSYVQESHWDRFGRFHPLTFAYSNAINFINEHSRKPDARPALVLTPAPGVFVNTPVDVEKKPAKSVRLAAAVAYANKLV